MNILNSNIFNTQSDYIHEQRYEVISQDAKFKLNISGFTEINLNDDISRFNQVLIADDKSSIVIIRPLINCHFNHTVINALTRDGFDEELLTEILDTFVFNNLQLAS